MSSRVNPIGDDAPYPEVHIFRDPQGFYGRIRRQKPCLAVPVLEDLDRHAAVQDRDDHVMIQGFEGLVYDHRVAGEDPDVLHAVAGHFHVERRVRVPDELFPDVQAFFDVVGCGRFETSANRRGDPLELQGRGLPQPADGNDVIETVYTRFRHIFTVRKYSPPIYTPIEGRVGLRIFTY